MEQLTKIVEYYGLHVNAESQNVRVNWKEVAALMANTLQGFIDANRPAQSPPEPSQSIDRPQPSEDEYSI